MKITSVPVARSRPKTVSVHQMKIGTLYVAESTMEFGGFFAIRVNPEFVVYLDSREKPGSIWGQGLTDQTTYIEAPSGTKIVIEA